MQLCSAGGGSSPPAETAYADRGKWRVGEAKVDRNVRESAPRRSPEHLRNPLVLCDEDGEVLKRKAVRAWVRRAARRTQVQNDGVHVLKHTFCSHLAMRGAPARAIQKLAGYANLSTTQRYMHLSPAAI